MTTLRMQTSLILILLALLAGSALGVPAGAVVGTVESEVPGQVAVYRCRPVPAAGLERGDVVSVVRSGVTRGEATVLRASPDLVISLKGLFDCAPGDQVLYLRRPRGQAKPRPTRTPAPVETPAPSATPDPGVDGAAPAPAADATPPPQAPAVVSSPEDLAALQSWQRELRIRLDVYLRPKTKGKGIPASMQRLEKAGAVAAKARYTEASSLYGKLATDLQKEGMGILGADPVRGREAWSLGLESLSLRALCLYLADEPSRSRAAFEALARENPTGSLASSRSLSTVRGRANVYLKRLREAGGTSPDVHPKQAGTPAGR